MPCLGKTTLAAKLEVGCCYPPNFTFLHSDEIFYDARTGKSYADIDVINSLRNDKHVIYEGMNTNSEEVLSWSWDVIIGLTGSWETAKGNYLKRHPMYGTRLDIADKKLRDMGASPEEYKKHRRLICDYTPFTYDMNSYTVEEILEHVRQAIQARTGVII
jgi:hypothetical protein